MPAPAACWDRSRPVAVHAAQEEMLWYGVRHGVSCERDNAIGTAIPEPNPIPAGARAGDGAAARGALAGGRGDRRRGRLHRLRRRARPILRPAPHIRAQRPARRGQPVPVQRCVRRAGSAALCRRPKPAALAGFSCEVPASAVPPTSSRGSRPLSHFRRDRDV